MTDSVPAFLSGISQIEHGCVPESKEYWLYFEVLGRSQAKYLRNIRGNVGTESVILVAARNCKRAERDRNDSAEDRSNR